MVLIMECPVIPWSRVLLEKVTGSQLVKKFPTFYGTRRFNTAGDPNCPHSEPGQSMSPIRLLEDMF
jgi:hypothetical protein